MMNAVKRAETDRSSMKQFVSIRLLREPQLKKRDFPTTLFLGLLPILCLFLPKRKILEELNPKAYIGRAPEQVDDFLNDEVKPLLNRYSAYLTGEMTELKV